MDTPKPRANGPVPGSDARTRTLAKLRQEMLLLHARLEYTRLIFRLKAAKK